MTDEEKKKFLFQFGKRIKHYRIQKGMTLEELANRMGYTSDNARSNTQKIEAGKNDLPASKVNTLAQILQVPVGILMGWEEELQTSKEKQTIKECRLFDKCHGSDSFFVANMFLKLDNIDKTKMVERIQTLLEAEKYSQDVSKEDVTEINSKFRPLTDEEIEAEVADYRRELIEEKREKEKLSALQDLKES